MVVMFFFLLGCAIYGNFLYHFLARAGFFRKK